MKKIKKSTKRLLSVILTAAMVAGGVPQPANLVMADEISNEITSEVNNETELSTEHETESKIKAESEMTETETADSKATDSKATTEETVSETEEIQTEETQTEETQTEETQTEEITQTEETQTEETQTEETQTEETQTEETQTEENTETETAEEDILSVLASEDFVISNGVLTQYKGTAEDVVIPDNVKEIGESVFEGNTTIRNITFPSSLKKVGKSAFDSCTNLKSINMNEGLETIEAFAFYNCEFGCEDNGKRISGKITIPSTVKTIGKGAFKSFNYLEEIIFANGTTQALTVYSESEYPYNYAFGQCTELKKVELPERLLVIPAGMFYGNTSLKDVTFGSKVEEIGEYAFAHNEVLEKIELPSTVKKICEGAFYECFNIKSISLNEGLETIQAHAFNNCAFGCEDNGKRINGKITIPSTVKTIGKGAFKSFNYLEEIIFANGTTQALTVYSESEYPYYYAFGQCTELKKVELPERLLVIPAGMFYENTSLKDVTFGSKVEEIGEYAFAHNEMLEKIELPSTVKTIYEGAFCECSNLKSVKLQEGIESIGKLAFYNCAFGKDDNGKRINGKITIPSTVRTIGKGAFKSFNYLEEIIFANGETQALTVYSEYEYPYNYAFGQCTELKKVELPERLLVIPAGMFYENTNLKYLTFGSKVEEIGEYAFAHNEMLEKIELPSTVKTIYEGAFCECSNLKALKMQEGIETIGKLAFYNCAFGKDDNGKKIKGKITIPSTVRTIGKGAFKGFDNLERIAFANGETAVLTINSDDGYPYYYAFGDCAGLKHVYLPDRLQTISNITFIDNPNLTALLIPETVTTIESKAIQNCPKLTIYGVKGSAAETYAKNNNIPFKDKSQLKMDDEEDASETSKDNVPKLDKNTVTININEENPSGTVHIYPAESYEIDETSLKLTGDDSFEIIKAENTSTRYIIRIKAGKSVAKGKYKVVLELKTTAKEENPYKLPLTINATQTIPTVTISNQKAINVYEKNSTGKAYISSDTPIKNIKFTSSAGSSEPRLVLKDTDVEEGSFTYELKNVTGQNYKNTVAKGRLVVEFEGYKTSAAYSKDITLKINKKLPVYTAEALTMFIDTELDNAAVKVIASSDKKAVKISDGYEISIGQELPSGYKATAQTKKSPLKISVKNGAKSTTLKLLVKNSNWIDGLSIPVKCKVTIGKKPVLVFTNSTIILNTAYAAKKYKAVETTPYVKGFYGFEFSSIEFVGKNAKSKEVFNNGALSLKYTDNVIKAEITDASYFNKKGTYTYDVKAVTSQGLTLNKTLKVNVVTSAPKLSFKSSGSIDLLDRENTCVKYKVSVKNYTGEIEAVQLTGENADKFDVSYNDGFIMLKAKAGKALSINKQYTLTVKAELTNGAEIQGDVKLKLKQKTPKLTTNVKKLTMHKSVPGSAYGYQIAVKNIKGSKIESIELLDGFDTFAYDYKASGKGNLYVLKDANGKINKTYKLKFKVTLKDAAENAKPVYVIVSVKYMR